MSATELAAALAELRSPWMTAEVAAAYLGYEVRTFREKVAVKPGFPAPHYFGGSAMRWLRSDLDEWARSQPRKRQSSRSANDETSGA